MANTSKVGGSESSEDDSISLTSTIISDGDGKDYEVDCILAEFETDGVMSYLTKWDGYPIEVCTWQLKESFNPKENGHDVFKEWQERKMRISRGYEKALNIEAWEETVRKLEQATRDRRKRRERKKARLNQDVDALSSDPEDQGDNSARRNGRKTKDPSSLTSDSEGHETQPPLAENSTPVSNKAFWTGTEQQVFLKALQDASGPFWKQILGWYGHRGTISQDLSDKTIFDMQRQLQVLRQEFLDAGREPPMYMKATISRTDPGKSTEVQLQKRRQMKVASLRESDSSDGKTSTDSMMEEIKETKKSQAMKEKGTIRKAPQATESSETPAKKVRPGTIKEEPSNPSRVSDISHNGNQSRKPHNLIHKPEGTRKMPSPKTTTNSSILENTHSESTLQPTFKAEPTKISYTGTARQPPKATQVSESSDTTRIGVSTSGPARFSAPRSRARVERPILKAKVSGVDVLANWSGESKVKRSRTLPTTNATAGTDQPLKTFKTLGRRNNIQKWRRNEPDPNPANLVFIDRKTGKAPTTADAITGSLPKAPFEKYQAGFPEEEARVQQSIDHEETENYNEITKDDEYLPMYDAERSLDNTSGSNRDTAADRSPAGTPVSETAPQYSPPPPAIPVLPVNTPTGPRIDPSRPSQHLFHRSPSDPSLLTMREVNITAPSSARGQSHPDSGAVVLKGNPTQLERDALFQQAENCLVMGIFVIGPQLKNIGKMKLAGFDRHVQRLLLTVKDSNNPKRLAFEFKDICSVTDYQSHWHNVSILPV